MAKPACCEPNLLIAVSGSIAHSLHHREPSLHFQCVFPQTAGEEPLGA